MRVLITGATGFVGSHLVEHLLDTTDWELVGVSRTMDHIRNVEHLLPRLRLQVADCDDPASIERAVDSVQPDAVIHLAGQASESQSWKSPAATFIDNVVGEINLFQALIKANLRPRTLVFGSAVVYGTVKPEENPVGENQTLRPMSPYAVSKIAADYLGYQYFASHQMPVVRIRPFNQIGPRQSPEFVVSAFAKQIAEIEGGSREPVLKVGNLRAVRDFVDIRDTMVAYKLLLDRGQAGEAYNIGSGVGHTVQELLERLLALSTKRIRVEQDPSLMRPVDVPLILADTSKLRAATGWSPAIPIEKSLEDTLNYWRSK